MRTYYDTSFVLKTYIQEANTPEAIGILRAGSDAIPLSHVLELELRTAMRNQHGRGELTAGELPLDRMRPIPAYSAQSIPATRKVV